MRDKDNTGQENPQNEAHDIYTDPDIAQTIKEDPILRFLVTWQRQISMLVLAGLAGFVLVHYYQKTQLASMKMAADSFAGLHDQYVRALSDYQEEKSSADSSESGEEAVEAKASFSSKVLDSKLKLLAEEESPYNLIGDMYRGLIRVKEGDAQAVEKALGHVNWKNMGDSGSPERFFAELTALVYARALLDHNTTFQRGWEELVSLASSGGSSAVSAVMTLSRIAYSKDQKAAVVEVINKIMQSNPEQAAMLEEDLEKLKS